jgi:hypothetical protein
LTLSEARPPKQWPEDQRRAQRHGGKPISPVSGRPLRHFRWFAALLDLVAYGRMADIAARIKLG